MEEVKELTITEWAFHSWISSYNYSISRDVFLKKKHFLQVWPLDFRIDHWHEIVLLILDGIFISPRFAKL